MGMPNKADMGDFLKDFSHFCAVFTIAWHDVFTRGLPRTRMEEEKVIKFGLDLQVVENIPTMFAGFIITIGLQMISGPINRPFRPRVEALGAKQQRLFMIAHQHRTTALH